VQAHRVAQLFVDLFEEAISSILKLDDLFRLELLHVVFIVGFFLGMVAFIEHI